MATETAAPWFDPKTWLNAVHNTAVFSRRVRVLGAHLASTIPQGPAHILDFGCGDGSIARALMDLRPEFRIEGVDVLIRAQTHIPVTKFDGATLPFADRAFDYVTVVDVLHHTKNPAATLTEACRVARCGVVIKDHLLQGVGAKATLRFMDWVGNRGHDVVLPYNYLTPAQWQSAFRTAGCTPVTWTERLQLYPLPASLLFDRRLHFVALMKVAGAA